MPLGPLAVGSALDPTRFDVRIHDARIEPDAADKILRDAERAACVGMTVFSGFPIAGALKLSRELKRRCASTPIIWGGWHPSILPEQCIASGAVDAVVIAQGEASFVDLINAIDDPARWQSISGLCVAVDGNPRRTAVRALERMDRFPAARYELLDVEAYFQRKGHRQLDYSSSRGCPYRCTFCADPMVYRSKWTALPPERVLTELQDLYARYRMDEVFFLDDDLFASLKRIQALVDVFIKTRTPFSWKGTARADELCRLPEDFWGRLRSAGCLKINVGAESGSQEVLDRIKKEYRVEEILRAGERASKAGVGISYSFITGFPGETERDFQATLDVLKAIRRLDSTLETSIYVYSPYPGTELVRDLQQGGFRLPDRLEDWENFNIEGAWLPRNNPKFVRRIRNLNFYLRHGYGGVQQSTMRRMLKRISRFRCNRDWYGLPIERYFADSLRGRNVE